MLSFQKTYFSDILNHDQSAISLWQSNTAFGHRLLINSSTSQHFSTTTQINNAQHIMFFIMNNSSLPIYTELQELTQ